jgi:thiol-disulfide isomerase/thioredoxin
MDPAPLLVACLCAEWCLTCKAYRDTLAGVAAAHPDVAFAWVDIEDHADALESDGHEAPDIVNFPTLLVLRGTEPLFFGTVLPHANVVERMLEPAKLAALPVLRDAATVALGQAVQALGQTQPQALALGER